MKHVEVIAQVAGRSAAELFSLLRDMRQYPTYSDRIVSLDIVSTENASVVSKWTLKLGVGTATWTQRNEFEPESNTIRFQALSGDIDELSGVWTVRDSGDGCELKFACDFDIGLPGLGIFIEPRIAALLSENIRSILDGMFGANVVIRE